MMTSLLAVPALVMLVAVTPAFSQMKPKEILELTNKIWNADQNRFPLTDNNLEIDRFGYKFGRSFFKTVNEGKLKDGSWPLFMGLLNNYNPFIGKREVPDMRRWKKEDTYLNHILQDTNGPMRMAWERLKDHGYVDGNINGFKNELRQIWFNTYSRSGGSVIDSSGFEHVFVGELLENGNKVIGFHNWQRFYQEEREGRLQYRNHLRTCGNGYVHELSFDWKDYPKDISGFHIGTSPEFEMAIYTICYLVYRDSEEPKCTVSINKAKTVIKISNKIVDGKEHIKYAYPTCENPPFIPTSPRPPRRISY